MGNSNSGRKPAHVEMRLKKGMISSRQLSTITGVSMETLHYWTKKGFITTAYIDGEGKGSRRVFREQVAVNEVTDLVQALQACPYDHKMQ